MTVTLQVRLPAQLHEALRELASEELDSLSHVVRRACNDYVKRRGRDGRDLARAHEGSRA